MSTVNKERSKRHYQENKEEYKERAKKWAEDNPEKRKKTRRKSCKKWRKNNKEKSDKLNIEWTERNPERKKEIHRRSARKWKKNNPECVRKCAAKRKRNLGYNPLNKKFSGSVGHHINKNDVIYIPEGLHRSISHRQGDEGSMKTINELAINWYNEQEGSLCL